MRRHAERPSLACWLAGSVAFATALLISSPDGTVGRSADAAQQLTIDEVHLDFLLQTMLIRGRNFAPGRRGTLKITLGDPPGSNDISDLCALDAPPDTITCDFSLDSGLPADGDYLLVVAKRNGRHRDDDDDGGDNRSHTDEYDLTIGAVGPQGEPGAQGAAGAQGQQGIPGVSGYEQIVGTVAAGSISPNVVLSSTATCSIGKTILGGGCTDLDTTPSRLVIQRSAPVGSTGWNCRARNDHTSNISANLRALAICANVLP